MRSSLWAWTWYRKSVKLQSRALKQISVWRERRVGRGSKLKVCVFKQYLYCKATMQGLRYDLRVRFQASCVPVYTHGLVHIKKYKKQSQHSHPRSTYSCLTKDWNCFQTLGAKYENAGCYRVYLYYPPFWIYREPMRSSSNEEIWLAASMFWCSEIITKRRYQKW